MKRIFDLVMAVWVMAVLSIPFVLVAIMVRLSSPGPVLYWSDRVGRYNRIFRMPKFRSMRLGTPAVATHLLSNPEDHLTPIGGFLRYEFCGASPCALQPERSDRSAVPVWSGYPGARVDRLGADQWKG